MQIPVKNLLSDIFSLFYRLEFDPVTRLSECYVTLKLNYNRGLMEMDVKLIQTLYHVLERLHFEVEV